MGTFKNDKDFKPASKANKGKPIIYIRKISSTELRETRNSAYEYLVK